MSGQIKTPLPNAPLPVNAFSLPGRAWERGQRALLNAVALFLAMALLTGCGGSSGKPDTARGGQSSAGAAADDQEPVKERRVARKKKQPGKIGDIPIDAWPEVWFKEPLAVAAEKGPGQAAPARTEGDGGAAVAQTPNTTAPSQPTESAAPKETARPADSNWAAIISGEDILDETKSIRNSLNQKLQDVGRFSSTYKELRVDATVLTALAGVAIEHPDAPSWKPHAKYIRDVSSEVARASTANGEKFFKPARKAYDKLDALFSGSVPPDVEDAAEKVKFSEVANRYYLMLRLRKIADWMKSEINSEAAFKKDGARLSHEAAMLALIAKVIEAPDYNDADLEEYRGYAEAVSRAGLDIGQAVKNGDFNAFTTALDACNKSCNKCHMQFKDGG